MTYNPNVPNLPNQVTTDIAAMHTNANQLNVIFGVDHIPYSPPTSTSGWHKQVRFPATISAPSLAAGQGSVYIATVAGRTELMYSSSSATTQITSASASGGLPIWKAGTPGGNGVVLGTPFSAGPFAITNGNTYDYGRIIFPTGLEFKWGWIVPNGGVVNNKVFEYPVPFPNRTINVQITGIRNSTNSHTIYIGDTGSAPNVTATDFTLISDAGSWDEGFYYYAIGN